MSWCHLTKWYAPSLVGVSCFCIINNLLHECSGDMKTYSPTKRFTHEKIGRPIHPRKIIFPRGIWFFVGESMFLSPSQSLNKCILFQKMLCFKVKWKSNQKATHYSNMAKSARFQRSEFCLIIYLLIIKSFG